jgi:hypothetical protein
VISNLNTVVVPVKTGATGGFRLEGRAGGNGVLIWSQDSDYVAPPHNWMPSFNATITPDGRVVVPGGGDPVLTRQGIGAPDAASDADEPSGAAALAEAAAMLWVLGAGEQYRSLAERLVATHASAALAQPLAYGALLRVATTLAAAPRQVVVVTDDTGAAIASAARGIRADVVSIVSPQQTTDWADAGFGLFADKAVREGLPTAYDCRDFACRLPVTDPAGLQP